MPEAALEPGQWRKVGDGVYSNKRGEMLVKLIDGGYRYYIATSAVSVNGKKLAEHDYIRKMEAEAKLALSEVLLNEAISRNA
jgi:hypothetical protein